MIRPAVWAVVATSLLAASACSTSRVDNARPGERPALDTDEAGLWLQMDQAEATLRSSGTLVRDPRLNAYVRTIVCRLAGPHCGDIRVYIVRNPQFNAMMAPNGMMQVWTGLLVRARTEAELSYILGHEIAHYQRRHSLQMWRDLRGKTAFVSVLSIIAGAAGTAAGAGGGGVQLGSLGAQLGAQVAGMATVGSVYAFSRDNEREADALGLEMMARAGYDAREAPKIWRRLIQEREAGKESSPPIFFATHPPAPERITALEKLAESQAQPEPTRVGREELMAVMRPVRPVLLNDELRRRTFPSTLALLDQLLDSGADLGAIHFFKGEVYRLRSGADDEPQAITEYRRAAEFSDAPGETYRGLGILLLRRGDRAGARAAFERYLEERPAADDREMIRARLQALE